MNLLLISSIVLAINIVMLYSYHQKSFFIKIHSDFHKEEKMGIISKTDTLATPQQLFGFSNKETQAMEARRLHNLNMEKVKLNKRLKALEFITNFEMYLTDNKIDMDRFNEFKDFNDLKLLTQKSILESAKKVSNLSAA